MANKIAIFVTGGPGTGKSFTTNIICKAFPFLMLLSYDDIKELFWDRYGFANKEEKEKINDLSLQEFYKILEDKMQNQENIISEYPFYQKHKDHLQNLVNKYQYDALTILLYGDKHVIYEREIQRNNMEKRHLGHLTNCYQKEDVKHIEKFSRSEEEFWKELEGKDYNISIGDTIAIDVTDFNNINYQMIYDWINKHR